MGIAIGILHPGEMGAAVGAVAIQRGNTVFWLPEGRSPHTNARADAAGLQRVRNLAELAEQAAVIVSLCPPHAAIDVATIVAASGYEGIFLDANAVSPATAAAIGTIVADAGAKFVDGGVIGGPPAATGSSPTKLYLSGARAAEVATVFGDLAVDLGPDPVAASALKMCYASWTKGTAAQLIALRDVARHFGVDDALLAEWDRSQPGLRARSNSAAASTAAKAWRFIGEMEEVAATFSAAGEPSGFGLAAAEVYRGIQRQRAT